MAREHESKKASVKPLIGFKTEMWRARLLFHMKRSKNVEMRSVTIMTMNSVTSSDLDLDLRTSRSMVGSIYWTLRKFSA